MLVIIRKELWLSSWSRKFGEHPVLAVRLRKSLYGHPKAGRWWQDHLTTCLIALGGIEMQEHASNFVFRWTGDDGKFHVIPLNVYLDDLTLSGHHSCHASFWKALSEKVKLDPFQEIGPEGLQILGRKHRIERGPDSTKITFDMRTFVDQVVSTYCELTGTPINQLKHVATPSFPESSMIDIELSQEGALSGVASRVLMRAFWLSRLARPDISFIIGRVTTRVTRWSRLSPSFQRKDSDGLHRSQA